MRNRLILFIVLLLLAPAVSLAAPTQQDVFKSINENVSESGDLTRLLPWVAAAGALICVVVIVNKRQKRPVVAVQALNHQKKLLREVSRVISLKSAELKILKVLSEEHGCVSPLTLLLCPSVLVRAARQSQGKVDKRAAGEIAVRLLNAQRK